MVAKAQHRPFDETCQDRARGDRRHAGDRRERIPSAADAERVDQAIADDAVAERDDVEVPQINPVRRHANPREAAREPIRQAARGTDVHAGKHERRGTHPREGKAARRYPGVPGREERNREPEQDAGHDAYPAVRVGSRPPIGVPDRHGSEADSGGKAIDAKVRGLHGRAAGRPDHQRECAEREDDDRHDHESADDKCWQTAPCREPEQRDRQEHIEVFFDGERPRMAEGIGPDVVLQEQQVRPQPRQ